MSIDRNNYEAFFLDYWEKTLAPEQVAELLVFLEENADLKEEFEIFENINLHADENIRYNQKNSLKKPVIIPTENISEDNFDEYMVAKLEGDISEDDAIELTAFMELNPKQKLHYNLYRTTVLTPATGIRFEDKKSLKKTSIFIIYQTQIRYGVSIAASIIILLGLYFGMSGRQDIKLANERNDLLNPGIEIIQPEISLDNNNEIVIEERNSFENTSIISIPKEEQFESQNLATLEELESKSINMIEIQSEKNPSYQYILSREYSIPSTADIASADDLPKQSSFLKRFIGGIAGKLINTENREKKSFFEMTVEGYNLMADKEVTVDKEVDENGKVVAYSVNGENLPFPRFNKTQQKQ